MLIAWMYDIAFLLKLTCFMVAFVGFAAASFMMMDKGRRDIWSYALMTLAAVLLFIGVVFPSSEFWERFL